VTAEIHNPLDQFYVSPLVHLPSYFGIDTSITNSALVMLVAVAACILLFTYAMRKRAQVPGRMQSLAEITSQYVHGIVDESAGHDGRKYFPIIFTIFLFILFINLAGMIPFSFTPTSHIIITFAMAAAVFIGVTIIGIIKKGPIGFLKHFIPPGLPLWMGPLLLVIEMVSYLVRPLSLSIRLAANMFAGHTLMAVIAGFVVPLGIFGIFPGAFLVALTALEIFVAILQAYVFALLSALYLGEALADDH
jgi:F-type H+-transporting ATPase subunit a